VLHSVIGDGRIPAALRSRFIEVLQTVGFDELARADTKMLGMALIFACDQARVISDERLIRRMGEILMGFGPVAASLANDEKAALPSVGLGTWWNARPQIPARKAQKALTSPHLVVEERDGYLSGVGGNGGGVIFRKSFIG
jgi:hypothetical protein